MKGVDTLIAAIFIIAISIAGAVIVLESSQPSVDRLKEISLFEESKKILTQIDNAVRTVSEEGEGSTRVLQLSVSGGNYFIDTNNGAVVFTMDSRSQIVGIGVSKSEGSINMIGKSNQVLLNISYPNINITGGGSFGKGYHDIVIRNDGYNSASKKQIISISFVIPPIVSFTDKYDQVQTLVLIGVNTTSPDNLNDRGNNYYNITEGLEFGGQHNYFQENTNNLTGFNTTSAYYTNSLDNQNYNVTSTAGQPVGNYYNQYNQTQTLVLLGTNTTSPNNMNTVDGQTYNITENETSINQSNTSSDLQGGTSQNKLSAKQNWYNLILNDTNAGISDSFVNESSKTANYGTATSIYVRQKSSTLYNSRAFLLWNMIAIPSGMTITNATLSLYASVASSQSRTLEAWNTSLYQGNASTVLWTESNIAWNSQPPINTSGAVLQYSLAAGTGTGWKNWTITNAVITAYNNATNKNVSIGIKDAAENSSTTSRQYTFTSRQGSATQEPQLNVTCYNWTTYKDANTTTTYYNNTYSNPVLSFITNISVTVSVSVFNVTGSTGKSSNPDLWLAVWNGTIWSEIGNMTVSTTGNDTTYVPNQDNIYAWWQNNPTQRNISIKGRYFDANANAWDEINYTDVWVKIDSKNITYRAEIEHNATGINWYETLNSINVSLNFTTNVTSSFNLTIYNFNSGSWNYTACQNGTANAGSWNNWWCNITSNPSFYNSSDGKIRIRLNGTVHSSVALIREDYVQYYVGYTTSPRYANVSIEHNSSTISDNPSLITKINVSTILKTNASSISFNFYIYNFNSRTWEPCTQKTIGTTYDKMECVRTTNPSYYISNSRIAVRLNSSGDVVSHQMIEDYLVYQVTMPSNYKIEVEHNATGIGFTGTLNNISILLNFSKTSADVSTFNFMIYNFNSDNWENCNSFSLPDNNWYLRWCNETMTPENYLEEGTIRFRLNETTHSNQAEVREDYVQYYVTYT